jgi:altronate hydrolase
MQTLRLHADDNVVVAIQEITSRREIQEEFLTARERIPVGHKLATRIIERDSAVYKYGQIIGFASRIIKPGEHVHGHNLEIKPFMRDHNIGESCKNIEHVPEKDQATFQGIVRSDGRVGTRNYIGVVSTVNCSASVAHHIADGCRPLLPEFPNVDGVVALTHGYGCDVPEAPYDDYLQRTFDGFIRHPNFAAVLLVGLGCEGYDVEQFCGKKHQETGPLLKAMRIQEKGGTRKTIRWGVEQIRKMLPLANKIKRQPVSARHLTLGLECGGSDAFSGITANPALGSAVDLLVRHGGTAILSETPEIYGAEHLLTRRAATLEAGEKIQALTRWWEEYTALHGASLDNNPSPGNKAGGLTNIIEKSLGAVAKAGSSNLIEVYQYAEQIKAKGLVFMDTPGYDPVSITGMVAGGANLVCFTTGRGSVFGGKPVPSLKLATHTDLYRRMRDDMDVNCGVILDGKMDAEKMGEQIFNRLLATASGEKTKSEDLGIGDNEFVPWYIGAVL